jgi:hypothetical protein
VRLWRRFLGWFWDTDGAGVIVAALVIGFFVALVLLARHIEKSEVHSNYTWRRAWFDFGRSTCPCPAQTERTEPPPR